MDLAIGGIGCIAPGLVGWAEARPILGGDLSYASTPLPRLVPKDLAPNERRRLGQITRLALSAGQDALAQAVTDASSLATVFTSASGDGEIIHSVCRELARPTPALSPTKFHHSVHNAPAGYWAIARQDHAPSTSVSAHDASFAAGLLEATTQVKSGHAVLLVAYDRADPFPLSLACPIIGSFACALLLYHPATVTAAEAMITLAIGPAEPETRLDIPELEILRRNNPAARALPWLAALARGGKTRTVLPYLDDRTLIIQTRSG